MQICMSFDCLILPIIKDFLFNRIFQFLQSLLSEQNHFKASFGGISIEIASKNIVYAAKEFGLMLCAGGFIPKFFKNNTGIIIEVESWNQHAYVKIWCEDAIVKGQKINKITATAIFLESNTLSPEHENTVSNTFEPPEVSKLELSGDRLIDTLRTVFKIPDFRPHQREVIESLLNGQHTLGILPTGSGKTLYFTLPTVMSDKITFAIFPLNSLMLHMSQQFGKLGITSCMINQYTTKQTINTLFHDFNSEQPKTKIVLITPESIQREAFQEILPVLATSGKLGLIAIDEIHCMAESSPDFRPDYKKLNFLTVLNVPILGLTATATHKVVEIISETMD